MSYKTNKDNKYEVGTIITSKSKPTVKLKIIKYFQRTYYCVEVGDRTRKQLMYFERELNAPLASDQLE
jgi:hypothetical protein